MKLLLKWKYNIKNEEKTFKQKIYIGRSVNRPYFCGGIHIVNLYNACYANGILTFSGDVPKALASILDENYFLNNGNNFGKFCAISDILGYTAKLAFNKIIDECKKIIKRGINEKITFLNNLCSRDDDFQSAIDEYLEGFNFLFNKYIDCLHKKDNNFGVDFYELLISVLHNYDDGNRLLIKKYLQEEKGRCFATFIKAETSEKYIAFSGFVDCEDLKILQWLDSKREPFVDVARCICNDCNAVFVQTNKDIALFDCDGYSRLICNYCNKIYIKKTLGDMISRQEPNESKDKYACCERKIFGYFNNATPSGDLFVKIKMCCECCKGYRYQVRQGAVINVFDGLGIV